MKTFKNVLLVALFFATATVLGQTKLTGKVVDEMGEPLPGANVVVKGTTNGSATDFDGKFMLNASSNTGAVVVSFVGYTNKTVSFSGASDLGTIALEPSNTLDEIVIIGKGVIDLAEERKTPVAVSTVRAAEIQAKAIGNVEVPEIVKNTPSVYVSGQTGFGDSQMFMRGFDQTNVAVLLNGQPVNGMEDGRIYWSNWAGIADVANGVQVQRGLGSSKLAISSVGGTMNLVMKSAERKKGGFVRVLGGNDGYMKATAAYDTGLNDKGWSFSFLLDHWQADRKWAEGTFGQGQTYFLAAGYKPNENHSFGLLLTGAPQQHGQRWSQSLSSIKNNPKYNQHWGYTSGLNNSTNNYTSDIESERTNYYHKPVLNFNWDWNINEKSSLSTVAYASMGSGGGTGDRGDGRVRTSEGQMDYYGIEQQNLAIQGSALPGPDGLWNTADDEVAGAIGNIRQTWFGPDGLKGNQPGPDGILGTDDDVNDDKSISGGVSPGPDGVLGTDDDVYNKAYIRRASVNNHKWFGLVSNYETKFGEYVNFNVGADFRFYTGDHFRQAVDFYGLTGWANDRADGNIVTETYSINPWSALFDFADKDQRIAYDYSEDINYQGAFTQIEYSKNKFSTFFQGAVSNQTYQRNGRMYGAGKSEKINKIGYNLKGGMSYEISDNIKVFGNGGYYSRQPFLDNVFTNIRYSNELVSPEVDNEDITSFELGWRFDNQKLFVGFDFYHTIWDNRVLLSSGEVNDVDVNIFRRGVQQKHVGAELDMRYQVTDNLNLRGFWSQGSWKFEEIGRIDTYNDETGDLISSTTGDDVRGVHVTTAPQTSIGFGADYEPIEKLKLRANWNYYDRHYITEPFNSSGFQTQDLGTLPEFFTVDAGLSYDFNLGGNKLTFNANVYNLFDVIKLNGSDPFGYYTTNGRTFNGSLKYNF